MFLGVMVQRPMRGETLYRTMHSSQTEWKSMSRSSIKKHKVVITLHALYSFFKFVYTSTLKLVCIMYARTWWVMAELCHANWCHLKSRLQESDYRCRRWSWSWVRFNGKHIIGHIGDEFFTGQMTQPTVSKHWRRKNYRCCITDNIHYMHIYR